MIGFVKRFMAKVRFAGCCIPGTSSISLSSKIKDSSFEGWNLVRGGCRIRGSVIGFGSYVAENSEIETTKIGRYCSVGPRVTMPTGTHPSRIFVSTSPVFYSEVGLDGLTYCHSQRFQELRYAEEGFSRIVGNDVWIGGGATILEGVTISDGAIVGAGALVVDDVPPYAVVGGVPAKVIRYRFSPEQIGRLLELKWWERDPSWLADHVHLFENIEDLLLHFDEETIRK